MIDDVKSFVDAAHILKDRGAYKIYALATHGILSADAPRLIDESPIDEVCIELVSKELNHLAAILHVYARGLNFIFVIIFQKENGNTFTLFIIFIVKSLQKERNSTNLLL